ncbi:MAG: hypothetical protein JXQ71_00835 [Verrucomicrobia bacterium]|nr:hypothetical protein [Verrucomicrobiota bacterium]
MNPQATFPDEANGWRAADRIRAFDRSTIFEYMDGAGELYLAYDFRRVLVREYTRPGARRIIAEVYDMSSSQDAYGVFTHDPEGEDVGVGQDNAYAAGLLCFWKGPRFVRILAEQETPQARQAVITLGRSLAEGVAEGPRPALLNRLPPDHLAAGSARYFHTQVSLNYFYYLADANVLRLSPQTEVVMAVYRPKGEKITLLIVSYESRRQAQQAYRQFGRLYLEDTAEADRSPRIEALEGGRHVGALLKGQCVALVFDAVSRAACERLLAGAAAAL